MNDMKNNKATINELAIILFWSIFIGWVGISIGLGALYPPLNYIAKPFVCPNGQITFEKLVNQATPNKTFYSADWYCTKADSTGQPINPSPYAGAIYGLVCFPVGLFLKRREDAKNEEQRKASEFRPYNNKNKSGLP
ncbi:MAG: hypothetical protein HYZ33_02000 [Ignavibacteriales bacterium]|nr:hypothetical protein [Ignavibacteriales bacterium]